MKMNIQRLRNLTTGRLHTNMGDIYEDIEFFTGKKGVMTHMLPNAARALEPFLKEQFPDERLWNGLYDAQHVGEIEVRAMNESEQKAFWKRYSELPSPFERTLIIDI